MLINSTKNTVCNPEQRLITLLTNIKNALHGRFFIVAALLFFQFFSNLTFGETNPNCQLPTTTNNSQHTTESAEVDFVIDGDTIVLTDGRHVRLIGINTPEIGRKGKASQAGAEAAYDFLSALLKKSPTIQLYYDTERFDRYRRTLAHLYLPNGENVQAQLLSIGLATPLTIPPNLGLLDCYQHHANQAIKTRQGLWDLADYQAMPSHKLQGNIRGYHVIQGKIENVNESRSSYWINLTGNFAIRITRDDLEHFDIPAIKQMIGDEIQVRGWIYQRKNQYRVRIRHSSDMILISK